MFRSLFKRLSPDETDLRHRVIQIAESLHPQVQFAVDESATDVILAGEIRIGLQNLKAKFFLSDQSPEALIELVKEHLAYVLVGCRPVPSWEAARDQLRPQIMPADYAAKVPLIALPFSQSLAVGVVLDEDAGYLYVRQEDAERWEKSPEQLLEVALANLEQASRGMQIQTGEKDGTKWVGIEKKDGFDAVRILLPRLRGFLGQKLGSPFHFGIPNRDFLICWNQDAADDFVATTAATLTRDFAEQPYPLSPKAFRVMDDGKFAEIES